MGLGISQLYLFLSMHTSNIPYKSIFLRRVPVVLGHHTADKCDVRDGNLMGSRYFVTYLD